MNCLIHRNGLSISTELTLWSDRGPADWTVESCTDEDGNEYEPTDAEVERAIEQAKDCFWERDQ